MSNQKQTVSVGQKL